MQVELAEDSTIHVFCTELSSDMLQQAQSRSNIHFLCHLQSSMGCSPEDQHVLHELLAQVVVNPI